MDMKNYLKFIEKREMDNFFSQLNGELYEYYDGYVSDMLEGQIHKWNHTSPVFIIAPTGGGKNFFVEKLVKNKPNEKFLLLSNRVALNQQMKIRMIKNLDCENILEELTEIGLKKLEKIKNITIKTYHKFYLDKILKKDQEKYEYIIMDEVHFLDSDSTFIPYTDEILNMIVSIRQSIRIYMTATPEYIFNQILAVEKNIFQRSLSCIALNCNFHPVCFKLVKANNSIKHVKFYQYFENLLPIIKKDNSKWLIFVDSISLGKKICILLSQIGKTVNLITSETKNKESGSEQVEYQNIIKKEYFESDILVSTKTCEVGINLKLTELKNIVINDLDYVSFKQKIGRKRVLGFNDKINLYVKIPSLKEVNRKLNECTKQMKQMYYLEHMNEIETELFINHGDFFSQKNICYLKNGKIKTNSIAWLKLKRDSTFFEMILHSVKQNPYNPMLLVLHWLNPYKDTISANINEMVIDSKERAENIEHLKNFLEKHLNQEINDKNIEIFKNEFKNLYLKYFEYDNKRKTSRSFGKNIISSIIKELNLPYKIYGNKNSWMIVKGEN